MENEESKAVTMQQAVDANEYIQSYFDLRGWDYSDVTFKAFESEEEYNKLLKRLPKDVAAAFETVSAFWDGVKKEGIIP